MICKQDEHNFTGWVRGGPCRICGRTSEDLYYLAWLFMETSRRTMGRDPDSFYCDMCDHTDSTLPRNTKFCPKCGSD